MPRMSATIDCTAVAEAGHVIPDGYGPIPVQIFLNNVIASEYSIANSSNLNIVRLFGIVHFLRNSFSSEYALTLYLKDSTGQ